MSLKLGTWAVHRPEITQLVVQLEIRVLECWCCCFSFICLKLKKAHRPVPDVTWNGGGHRDQQNGGNWWMESS